MQSDNDQEIKDLKKKTFKSGSSLKPQFKIAGKFLDLKDVPSNAIADHLDLELAKRDELAEERLPNKRLRILKR